MKVWKARSGGVTQVTPPTPEPAGFQITDSVSQIATKYAFQNLEIIVTIQLIIDYMKMKNRAAPGTTKKAQMSLGFFTSRGITHSGRRCCRNSDALPARPPASSSVPPTSQFA